MIEDHKKRMGISEAHSLVQTETIWKQRKGMDTDYYFYDELDAGVKSWANIKLPKPHRYTHPLGRPFNGTSYRNGSSS